MVKKLLTPVDDILSQHIWVQIFRESNDFKIDGIQKYMFFKVYIVFSGSK